MVRSSSSSSSISSSLTSHEGDDDDDDDDDCTSNSGSNSLETSYRCSGSLSSCSSFALLPNRAAGKSEREDCDFLATERMERDQRLRRLLSQRKVGDTVVVDDGKNTEPFTLRKGALDADDGVLLSTFSNALLFARLLILVNSCESQLDLQNVDDILAAANPIFYRNFKVPLEDVKTRALPDSPVVHCECAALERCGVALNRRKHDRPAGFGSRPEPAAQRRRLAEKEPRVASATSGIIAKSLQQWEEHLSGELKAEGVSLESFRQQRHGSSHLEERRFLEASRWADYQRELRLEEKLREQQARRMIRRGENGAN